MALHSVGSLRLITASISTQPITATKPTLTFLARAIEATWLAGAFLIPVTGMHENFMLGYVQMPKVFLLRSLALLLVALVSLEWALSGPQRDAAGDDDSSRWKKRRARTQAHPARLILLATATVLAANVISMLLSPLRTVSFGGNNPGLDTYGLYSVLAYLVFFAVVAPGPGRMRSVDTNRCSSLGQRLWDSSASWL